MNIFNLLPHDINSSKLYENTFNKALYNIASKYHLGYEAPHIITLDHLQNFTFQTPKIDESLVFIAEHPNYNSRTEEIIRKDCPNAKIILVSSDSVYYQETITGLNVELYLTTMKSEIPFLSKYGKVEHFYWTISSDVIDEISELPDVERDIIGICLCNNSLHRNWFFGWVQKHSGGIVKWGLNLNDFTKVYKLFKRSQFVIGISMSAPGWGDDNKRSAKGMRDFVGVAAGATLIYDDYPDIVDIGVIPVYEYMNPDSCWKTMQFIRDIPGYVNDIQGDQLRWLKQNTMEIQLEKILLKHNIL